MKKSLLFLLFTTLLFLECNENPTPPEELPPGYQQDIPWPSLADSPWPMFRGGPQGTNRSRYSGPTTGTIEWINEDFRLTGGFSIGSNNDLFAASAYPAGIYKLDILTGKLNWKYDSLFIGIIDLHPCPIILKNLSIIATTGNKGEVISLSQDGKLNWVYKANSQIYNRGITVTKENLIIFVDKTSTLHAVDINGNLAWKHFDTRFGFYGHQTPVFSPDGKTLYLQGVTVGLVAFNLEDKQVLWTFGEQAPENYPLVDSQGHIYILSTLTNENDLYCLYSLNPDGSIRWVFETNSSDVSGSLSMNKSGEIYFCGYEVLYCVDYQGKLKFHKNIGAMAPVPFIIDSNDDLYILLWENNTAAKLNKNGELIWKLENSFGHYPGYSCISNYNQWIISDYQYNPHIISIK